jgi:hypothetical protein
MTFHTVILLNGILDLLIVLAVAATMRIPFALDRRRTREAVVYAFATPLLDELAA